MKETKLKNLSQREICAVNGGLGPATLMGANLGGVVGGPAGAAVGAAAGGIIDYLPLITAFIGGIISAYTIRRAVVYIENLD